MIAHPQPPRWTFEAYLEMERGSPINYGYIFGLALQEATPGGMVVGVLCHARRPTCAAPARTSGGASALPEHRERSRGGSTHVEIPALWPVFATASRSFYSANRRALPPERTPPAILRQPCAVTRPADRCGVRLIGVPAGDPRPREGRPVAASTSVRRSWSPHGSASHAAMQAGLGRTAARRGRARPVA